MRFDALVAKRGVAKNRSEVIRDLVRDALIQEETELPGTEVMGTLTIVFDHHASDVQENITFNTNILGSSCRRPIFT